MAEDLGAGGSDELGAAVETWESQYQVWSAENGYLEVFEVRISVTCKSAIRTDDDNAVDRFQEWNQ